MWGRHRERERERDKREEGGEILEAILNARITEEES